MGVSPAVIVQVNGFPKSGTHALAKACELLGLRAMLHHAQYGDDVPSPHLFIARDPRDVAISAVRFIGERVTDDNVIAMLRRFRVGDGRTMTEAMQPYEPWLREALVVRYEALVADDRELRRVAGHLGVEYRDEAFRNLPGLTATWNAVRSDWRRVWSRAIEAAWKEIGGPALLQRWGYA